MRGLKRPDTHDELDHAWDTGIADECETFLSGRHADALRALGHFAPVWSWLNEAAHADEAHLRSVADSNVDDTDVERRTRRSIARAVICATRDRELADLQRESLVPLELDIAGTDLSPRRLVELVGRALYL